MKAGGGGDGPGITGQRACEEAGFVIDKMSDDHFDDLLGEPGGRGREYRRNIMRSIHRTRPPDPKPHSLDE